MRNHPSPSPAQSRRPARQPRGPLTTAVLAVLTLLSGLALLPLATSAVAAEPAGGTVVGWGVSDYGQTAAPAGLTDVTAIAAGNGHSLALKRDGTVVGWGDNSYGQTAAPAGLTDVTAIAAGHDHSLALKRDGTVVGWGNSNYGQTAAPAGLTDVTAVAGGGAHSLALRRDGTVVGWGNNAFGQIAVPAGLTDVTAIAAGDAHSLALKRDGTVVGWGDNAFGQIAVPAGLTDVTAIAAGAAHSLALKRDGTVVGWGISNYGQTAAPAGLTDVTAIAAGNVHSLALRSDGTVVALGNGNLFGGTRMPAGLTGVTAIAVGNAYSLAIGSVNTPPAVAVVGVDAARYEIGAEPAVTCAATDAQDGPSTPTPVLTRALTFGTVTATCSVTDSGGLTATASTSYRLVDTTAPSVPTFVGGPADGSSAWFGSTPAAPTCQSSDSGSGLALCTVTGYSTAVGTHTLTATAVDRAGNGSTATRSYTVTPWTLQGFYAPVDGAGTVNTVRAGSTVPLKFELFAATERTALTDVTVTTQQTPCVTARTDAVETLTTEAAGLKHTGEHYQYNWKTPTTRGACYRATATATDGTSTTALFQLK